MLVTESNAEQFLTWLGKQTVVAVDTETTGLDPYGIRKDRICGLAVYANGKGWYLPVRHGSNKAIGYAQQTEEWTANVQNVDLRYLFRAHAILDQIVQDGGRLLMWNAKFDLHMMCADGFSPEHRNGIDDYMLSTHLINENEPSFGLKEYSDKYGIGTGSVDERTLQTYIEDTLGISTSDKTWKGDLHRVQPVAVEPYAVSDVELTWLIAKRQWPLLEARKLMRLFSDINRYNLLLFRMERRGILLDHERIDLHKAESKPALAQAKITLREQIAGPLAEAQSTCELPWPKIGKSGKPLKIPTRDIPVPLRITPETFNPGSPSHILALFPHWPKTDVAFLDSLEKDDPDYPFAQAILDYRVLSKMEGTYYDAYLSLIDASDTLRPNYNLHGTVTGRLSCSRPNLQNVPRYTTKRRVKEVFVSRSGYKLVEVDYKSAELRIATHYAQEERMADAFIEGRDLHTETTVGIGLDPETDRHIGKTLNFAVIYGAGVRGLTKLLKCDPETARSYLYEFRNLYPGLTRLANDLQSEADTRGVIVMDTGRRCNFKFRGSDGKVYPYMQKKGKGRFPIETRKAMNRKIQGTSSEMLRVAMQNMDDAIHENGIDAHLLLQVHDSVMFEVRETDLEQFRALLRPVMTNFAFYPPPDIDAKIGDRWSDMEGWEV